MAMYGRAAWRASEKTREVSPRKADIFARCARKLCRAPVSVRGLGNGCIRWRALDVALGSAV